MSDSSHSLKMLREAQQTARRVMVDGVLWLVYELQARQFDRRGTTSLVFESEMAVRRVRDFPTNWRMLTDEQLLTLSWTA